MLTDFLTNKVIVNADLNDLVITISDLSRDRFDAPESVARQFKQLVRDSYRLDKVASDSVSMAMASSFRLIQTYQDEINRLDKEIVRLINPLDNQYLNILTSIKGVGLVYAAGIIAEIGDISFFKDSDHLAGYCGLRWKRKDSGSKNSDHTKQPDSCNSYLRYYFVEAAASIIRYSNEYASFYYRKRNEVKLNAHKRALVLTARKFVRLVFGMLRNHKLFDNHYLAASSQI